MRELGYDRPLYILPFDHRGSYLQQASTLEEFDGDYAAELAAAQGELVAAKYVVYDAFRAAVASGVSK